MLDHLNPRVQTAVRTLLAAGFSIISVHRQPTHIELSCCRTDMLGSSLKYLIAITDKEELSNAEIDDIKRTGESEGQAVVIIARTSSDYWISWSDFLEALGGAIPSWQA